MPKSVNRKAIEIPLPLHAALSAAAEKSRDSTARFIAHALQEWMQQHHPDLAPKNPYMTEQQEKDYYKHWGHGPIKRDGYRR